MTTIYWVIEFLSVTKHVTRYPNVFHKLISLFICVFGVFQTLQVQIVFDPQFRVQKWYYEVIEVPKRY